METKKILRDESTPDRKEIWTFVDRAAARSDSAIQNGELQPQDKQQSPPSQMRMRAGVSGQE